MKAMNLVTKLNWQISPDDRQVCTDSRIVLRHSWSNT